MLSSQDEFDWKPHRASRHASVRGAAKPMSEFENELVCDICCELMKGPVSLPCGHIYCSECVRKHLSASSAGTCPNCRQPATTNDLKAVPRLAALLGLWKPVRGAVLTLINALETHKEPAQDSKVIAADFGSDDEDDDFEELGKEAVVHHGPTAGGEQGRPLPPPVLKHMLTKDLKKRLRDDSLSTKGDRPALEGRYREFVLVFNSRVDAGEWPVDRRAVAAEVSEFCSLVHFGAAVC